MATYLLEKALEALTKRDQETGERNGWEELARQAAAAYGDGKGARTRPIDSALSRVRTTFVGPLTLPSPPEPPCVLPMHIIQCTLRGRGAVTGERETR